MPTEDEISLPGDGVELVAGAGGSARPCPAPQAIGDAAESTADPLPGNVSDKRLHTAHTALWAQEWSAQTSGPSPIPPCPSCGAWRSADHQPDCFYAINADTKPKETP